MVVYSHIKIYSQPHGWPQTTALQTKSTILPSVRNGGGRSWTCAATGGADVVTDHYLVVAQLKLKLAVNRSSNQRVIRKKFNIEKLNQRETRKKFEEELKDSLEQVYMEESDPTEQWTKIRRQCSPKAKIYWD